jgi:hypothetical protein
MVDMAVLDRQPISALVPLCAVDRSRGATERRPAHGVPAFATPDAISPARAVP